MPKKTIELNVWDQFVLRYRGVFQAKKETNDVIGDWYKPDQTIKIVKGSATELDRQVDAGSVDYIFTDPPYGAHIAYLDLLTMWHAWLGMEVSGRDRELEVIEGGELGKSKDEYSDLLAASIDQMFRALKPDRWMSMVFSHKDPAYWDAIVMSAQRAGFEYVNTSVQKAYQASLHKRKNPLKVLSGELILNFRKVTSPRTIAILSLGSDAVRLIKNVAELQIVRNDGASTEMIYNALIPALLENGLLAEVKKEFADITPLLDQEFDFSEVDGQWHIRPDKKLGSYVPVEDRISFYVVDYLKRMQRLGRKATFDDIVQDVMPNLVNGAKPSTQSILKVLEVMAYSPDGKHWELGAAPGSVRQLDMGFTEAMSAIPALPVPSEMSHTEAVYRLSKLALAAGLLVHVGKKEQSDEFNGERLGRLSLPKFPAGERPDEWQEAKIEQIDCIWLHADGRVAAAFEVEATTAITSGIDRFLELLKFDPEAAGRVVILAPPRRQKQLDRLLKKSHYIGHPMFMENKLAYMFYDELLRLYGNFVGRSLTADDLVAELDRSVTRPGVK